MAASRGPRDAEGFALRLLSISSLVERDFRLYSLAFHIDVSICKRSGDIRGLASNPNSQLSETSPSSLKKNKKLRIFISQFSGNYRYLILLVVKMGGILQLSFLILGCATLAQVSGKATIKPTDVVVSHVCFIYYYYLPLLLIYLKITEGILINLA